MQLFQLVSNFASALLCIYILTLLKMLFSWLPSRRFLITLFAIKLLLACCLFLFNLIPGKLTFSLFANTLPLTLLLGPMLKRFTWSSLQLRPLPLLSKQHKILLTTGYLLLAPTTIVPLIEQQPTPIQSIAVMQSLGQLGFVLLFLVSSSYYFLPLWQQLHQGQLFGFHFTPNSYTWLKSVWIAGGLIWLTLVVDFISDLFDYHPLWRDILAFCVDLAAVMLISIFTVRYCRQEDFKTTKETFSHFASYEKSGLTPQQAQSILSKLDELMQQQQIYLDSELSLDKAAQLCHCKGKYLSQALNQQRQINYYEYLASYRIAHAKKLLEASNDSVLNIAYDAGFNAKSTFNHAFKKLTGQTPTEFRNQHST